MDTSFKTGFVILSHWIKRVALEEGDKRARQGRRVLDLRYVRGIREKTALRGWFPPEHPLMRLAKAILGEEPVTTGQARWRQQWLERVCHERPVDADHGLADTRDRILQRGTIDVRSLHVRPRVEPS